MSGIEMSVPRTLGDQARRLDARVSAEAVLARVVCGEGLRAAVVLFFERKPGGGTAPGRIVRR